MFLSPVQIGSTTAEEQGPVGSRIKDSGKIYIPPCEELICGEGPNKVVCYCCLTDDKLPCTKTTEECLLSCPPFQPPQGWWPTKVRRVAVANTNRKAQSPSLVHFAQSSFSLLRLQTPKPRHPNGSWDLSLRIRSASNKVKKSRSNNQPKRQTPLLLRSLQAFISSAFWIGNK